MPVKHPQSAPFCQVMSSTCDFSMVQLPSDDSGDEIELPSGASPICDEIELPSDVESSEDDRMEVHEIHTPAGSEQGQMWMEKLKFEDLYQHVMRGNEPFQLLAEVFSPPRITKSAQHFGHQTMMAFDIVHNGWDCMDPTMRNKLREIILKVEPKVLVLSPPCTMFSALTRRKKT